MKGWYKMAKWKHSNWNEYHGTRNNNVFQVTSNTLGSEYYDPDARRNGYYFVDKDGYPRGPYTSESDALRASHEYDYRVK